MMGCCAFGFYSYNTKQITQLNMFGFSVLRLS